MSRSASCTPRIERDPRVSHACHETRKEGKRDRKKKNGRSDVDLRINLSHFVPFFLFSFVFSTVTLSRRYALSPHIQSDATATGGCGAPMSSLFLLAQALLLRGGVLV